jgi:2-polyprenylphenol 6-hydroxylase
MRATDTNTETTYYDIVIVGAGLVGASCAALLSAALRQHELAQHEIHIAIIDGGNAPQLPDFQQDPPVFDPRVVALTHASQNVFESLGLWPTIQAQRACHYTQMQVWDNDGTAHIHFSAADIQQKQLGHIVENSVLQCALLAFLEREKTVSLLRPITVTAIDTHTDHTVLHCSDDTHISAGLLIAADGGQSKIRELANMPIREWDYQHKAIVATVQSSRSHQFTAWQNFLSTGPLAFLPLDHPGEQYCSIVWSLDTDKADEMMSLNDEEFSKALARAFEHRLGDVRSVSKRFCFPLRQRHAVDYFSENVVLIGDAAHTIHPLAGQGVNLGLLDAQALVVEIIRGIERGLPVNDASLLRRYQRRRKANNMEVMLLMEGLKRLFSSRSLAVRWLRNIGLKKVNELTILKNWLAKQAIKNNGH